MTTEPPRDWRGVPITPGARVNYGASVGHSIALVEAVVREDMLTPTGRIRLQVVSRAYGYAEAETVSVRADRLVVVGELPEATS